MSIVYRSIQKFSSKARLVSDVREINASSSIIYSIVVPKDSTRIALLTTSLNTLEVSYVISVIHVVMDYFKGRL